MATAKDYRVLIVEDNPVDTRLAAAALQAEPDFHAIVRSATSVRSAAETLHGARFDIVLLDLGLPDAQGIDTLTRVLEMVDNAPIIVLTGSAETRIGLQCMDIGADDFVCKADLGRDLARVVTFALRRRRALALRAHQQRTPTARSARTGQLFIKLEQLVGSCPESEQAMHVDELARELVSHRVRGHSILTWLEANNREEEASHPLIQLLAEVIDELTRRPATTDTNPP